MHVPDCLHHQENIFLLSQIKLLIFLSSLLNKLGCKYISLKLIKPSLLSENNFLAKIHGLSTNQANWIQIGRDSVEMRHILIESRVTGTSEAEA